jgi:membrane protein
MQLFPRSGIKLESEMGENSNSAQANALSRNGAFSPAVLKALPQMLAQASNEWFNDNAPRLGAAIAFYTLLSLAPVVVIAVAVAAVAFGPEAAQGRLAAEIQGMAGPDVARAIQALITGANQPQTGLIATVMGVITLIFGASSVFVELHDAMNTIWGVPLLLAHNKAAACIRMVRDRFYSFVTVMCIGLLLLIALLTNAWVVAMNLAVSRAATFLILYLLIAVLFATLYKVVPDVPLKWSDVVLGATITSMLFMLGKQVIGLYFANANFGSTYGAAGSPVVLLLWMYYSSQLFFWGAEVSKVYARTLGSHHVRQY